MKTWFSRLGIKLPPSGTAVMSSGDSLTVIGSPRVSAWPAESFTVASIRTRAAPWAKRASGEVSGQLQIEMIDAVTVCLALDRSHVEYRDIHAGNFDRNLSFIHRLAEEIIGMDGPGYMIAGTIAALRLIVLAREIDRRL